MGVPMRASSTGLLSPAAPRGPRFQVEGTTSWKLSIFLPLILIQCDRAPRGASTRPTPLDSSGMSPAYPLSRRGAMEGEAGAREDGRYQCRAISGSMELQMAWVPVKRTPRKKVPPEMPEAAK